MYCEFLGYEIEILKDATGSECGICKFPDGTSIEEFEFFSGKSGEKWSYGARHGYEVVNKIVHTDRGPVSFANCIKRNSDGKIIEVVPQILLIIRNKENIFTYIDTVGMQNLNTQWP